MVRERMVGLGRVLRQQPYEAAVGLGALSGIVEAVTARGSTALSLVIPHWALHALGVMIALGGALTLCGLVLAGVVVDDVRRVVARRMEQAGQIMISGVLAAIGIGAATYGVSSLIPGVVDIALASASAVRAGVIADTFRSAGRMP